MSDIDRVLNTKTVYDRALRKDAETTHEVAALLMEVEAGNYRRAAQAAACVLIYLCAKAGLKPFSVLKQYYHAKRG